MDSLPSVERFASFSATNLLGCTNQDLPHINWSHPFNVSYNNVESGNMQQTLSCARHNQIEHIQDATKQDESTCANTGHNLENVSLSILSLSLK